MNDLLVAMIDDRKLFGLSSRQLHFPFSATPVLMSANHVANDAE